MFIYDRTQEEHDQNLINFLNRTRQHGLTIGPSKIQNKKTSVEFYGLQFTTNGHKSIDKKFHDIHLMLEPKDIKQLQSFLGMINYLNRYRPKLAELTASLHDLTKEKVPFIWGLEPTEAIHAAKKEIQHAPLLA